MNERAFLYTGITFLIMASVIITANYFLLSDHLVEKSKTMNIWMDSINTVPLEVKDILGAAGNNSISDALSDVSFKTIMTFGTAHPDLSAICERINPYVDDSNRWDTNVSQWVIDYFNQNALFINRTMKPLALSYAINSWSVDMTACTTTGLVATFDVTLDLALNDSGSLLSNEQDFVSVKTLRFTDARPIYQIAVIDESGAVEFSKKLYCPSSEKCSLACDNGTPWGACAGTQVRCVEGKLVNDPAC